MKPQEYAVYVKPDLSVSLKSHPEAVEITIQGRQAEEEFLYRPYYALSEAKEKIPAHLSAALVRFFQRVYGKAECRKMAERGRKRQAMMDGAIEFAKEQRRREESAQ